MIFGARGKSRVVAVAGLAGLVGLVAGQLALTHALVAGTLVNSPSTFASTALYSPTGLSATWANCSGSCIKLSWTAPANNNGNGYAISGVNNGTSSSCPTTVGAYATYIASTASTTYTDSGSIAAGAQGTYACYLVQSAYNPAGAPPWGSVPNWASQTSLATASYKLGIYSVQIGTELQVATSNVTPTLPAASTAGNLLVFTGWNNSCSACGFSAPAGWVRAVRVFGATVWWSEIWYYPFNPGGIVNATFTATGTSAEGQLSEFSGVYGTTPLDQTGSLFNSTSVTNVTVSTASPTTVAGDLAVTNYDNTAGGTFGASPSGWTHLALDNANGILSDYRITGSPATIGEKATYSLSVPWGATIATFKASHFSPAQVQAGSDLVVASGNVTPTLPAASTGGNLLVFTGRNNSGSAAGFAAPAGWTRAARIRLAASGWSEIWYYANNPGGISSAAFTSTGTSAVGQLSEYSGLNASTPLDASGTVTATSVNNATVSSTGSTTQIGELVIAVFNTSSAGTFTSPSGWTHIGNDGANKYLADYMVLGSTAIASEKVTYSVSASWSAAIATFKT